MKQILVPTDFSKASMSAYRFALDVASLVNAEVTVIHVIDIPVIQETTFGLHPYLFARDMFRDVLENASRIYDRMRALYPTEVPVHFQSIHDDLVGGLTEYTRTHPVDLVIMSTHGASEIEDFVTGTETKRFARHSPVPVLAVPHEMKVSSIRNIVFPNSLESDQEHLIRSVEQLRSVFDATLHLLFVNTPSNFHSEEDSRRLLRGFATYYSLKKFTVNYRYDDTERNGIVSFANEIKADMIAMGTHGRTGIAHLLKGSIAESVLLNTECPVWISKLS